MQCSPHPQQNALGTPKKPTPLREDFIVTYGDPPSLVSYTPTYSHTRTPPSYDNPPSLVNSFDRSPQYSDWQLGESPSLQQIPIQPFNPPHYELETQWKDTMFIIKSRIQNAVSADNLFTSVGSIAANIISAGYSQEMILLTNYSADINCLYQDAFTRSYLSGYKSFEIVTKLIKLVTEQNAMLGFGFASNVKLWNTFFGVWFAQIDFKSDTEFLQYFSEMQSGNTGIMPTVDTFNAILGGIRFAYNSFQNADNITDYIIQIMPSYRIEPNSETYAIIIGYYTLKNNYHKTTELLLISQTQFTPINVTEYIMEQYKTSFNGATVYDYNKILNHFYSHNDYYLCGKIGQIALYLYDEIMSYFSVRGNCETYLIILKICGVLNFPLKATNILITAFYNNCNDYCILKEFTMSFKNVAVGIYNKLLGFDNRYIAMTEFVYHDIMPYYDIAPYYEIHYVLMNIYKTVRLPMKATEIYLNIPEQLRTYFVSDYISSFNGSTIDQYNDILYFLDKNQQTGDSIAEFIYDGIMRLYHIKENKRTGGILINIANTKKYVNKPNALLMAYFGKRGLFQDLV